MPNHTMAATYPHLW